MLYKIAYYVMLGCYLFLSCQGEGLRMKSIGFVLTIANAIIFYR